MKTEMIHCLARNRCENPAYQPYGTASQSYTLKQIYSFNPGFLNLGTSNILAWITLYCVDGGCPVHCRIFSTIPGPHPLGDSGIPQL